MVLSIMTIDIVTLRKMTLSITLSIMTHSIMIQTK